MNKNMQVLEKAEKQVVIFLEGIEGYEVVDIRENFVTVWDEQDRALRVTAWHVCDSVEEFQTDGLLNSREEYERVMLAVVADLEPPFFVHSDEVRIFILDESGKAMLRYLRTGVESGGTLERVDRGAEQASAGQGEPWGQGHPEGAEA